MTAAHPISVVGVVGGEFFGAAAYERVAGAEVVIASPRHLASTATHLSDGATLIELAGPLPPLIDQAAEHRGAGRRVVVLSSGDPGYFGIVRLLAERFGTDGLDVFPAPSSVSIAASRAGWTWEDAVVVSAHGRPLADAVAAALTPVKCAVLTAPSNPPEVLGQALCEAGCGPREVIVASRLGETDESVTVTDLDGLVAGTFSPMSVVLLRDPAAGAADGPSVSTGRQPSGRQGSMLARRSVGAPVDAFEHRDSMITKPEVRAVVLAKLDITDGAQLWDIGAGSGSVGIEAATCSPSVQVWAVERDADDAANIITNAERFGVPEQVEVVVGESPDVLAGLPDPTRVFVGGGGIAGVRVGWERLSPGGVLVATFVVLERAIEALELCDEIVQVAVNRVVPIGSVGHRIEPMNPVFVCRGVRR